MDAAEDERGSDCTERRTQRRLKLCLPVECRRDEAGGRYVVRTITQNVSSGGMYLELDSADLRPGDHVDVELTIPPAEGVSPYEGRASCTAEVLRVRPVEAPGKSLADRYGIAARFLDRPRISYVA